MCGNLSNFLALTAPQHVRGHIIKDAVEISWEHSHTGKSFSGYYIIVKDVGSDQKENPVYVHVDCSDRSTQIIGLRPGTTYQLTVNRGYQVFYSEQ